VDGTRSARSSLFGGGAGAGAHHPAHLAHPHQYRWSDATWPSAGTASAEGPPPPMLVPSSGQLAMQLLPLEVRVVKQRLRMASAQAQRGGCSGGGGGCKGGGATRELPKRYVPW
jgi:hypothetical protein